MPKRLPVNEYDDDLERQEEDLLSEDQSFEQPPTDIVTFNELRSCADLVRMYETDQLHIQPDFQRDIVWPNASQTRFIDSLAKQLPIPSMCFGLDYNTNSRIVIDGLQRMWSIIRFLRDPDWKLSPLSDIDPRISGRRVAYIKDKMKEVYGKVQNLTIPVTVLRCDFGKQNHMEYLFTIFHRLNTGGNKLTNQEIRNCIYSGAFNNLLDAATQNKKFRDLFGLQEAKGYRYAYEEFVLRVFAFTDEYDKYDGNLSRFLNRYMDKRRKFIDEEEIAEKKSDFDRTVSVIFDRLTDGSPLPKLSKATYEAVFVGIMRNIATVEALTKLQLRAKFALLRRHDEFSIENLKNALTTKAKLIARMDRADEIFSR